MADLLLEDGRLDEAQRRYRLAVACHPADSLARRVLAEALVEEARVPEA